MFDLQLVASVDAGRDFVLALAGGETSTRLRYSWPAENDAFEHYRKFAVPVGLMSRKA
jgi:hypothetical protein